MKNLMNKDSIKLGIETLENKEVVLEKLGIFFLLATHIEKILAEYIFKATKNNKFRDKTLGVKEIEFNKIISSNKLKYYNVITLLLKDFRERRNDITHKTLVIDPHYFDHAFSINWHDADTINKELSDEISIEGYVHFLNNSIDVGRNLLLELLTLFLFEGVSEKEFENSKKMLTQKPFCFNNKHC